MNQTWSNLIKLSKNTNIFLWMSPMSFENGFVSHFRNANGHILKFLHWVMCGKKSKLLFRLRCLSVRFFVRPSVFLQKYILNGCKYQKMFVYKVVTFLKRIKMAVLFFDFFRSDPSKMDQTWSNLNKLDFLTNQKMLL